MLRLRILSAAVMIAVLVAAIVWLSLAGWAALMLVLLGLAAWEWGAFARLTRAARLGYIVVVAAACLLALLWTGVLGGGEAFERLAIFYVAAGAFWMLGAPAWILRIGQSPPRWLVALAGMLILVSTYLAIVDLRALGAGIMLMVMAIVWVADVVAYFAGRAFGRHKLAPLVSPGKTVEGALGALMGVATYAIVASAAFQAVRSPVVAVLGVAILLAVLSIVGDLFESALKRQVGLKDSGTLLPGHGGVLDRIDALLPVLPIAALILPR
jgi:phosphatidate cytidylyltransferase